MKKQTRISTGWWHYWLVVGLLCLVTLSVSLSVRLIFRRTVRVTLPDNLGAPPGITLPQGGRSAVTPLDVTPDTVQSVIATLSRQTRYRRGVQIRRTWSGGAQDTFVSVTVSGAWTRSDRSLPAGGERHAVTNGVTTYIWYDDDPRILKLPAGNFSADNEQLIPTYEDVLKLPRERIALADYHRVESGLPCLYIETTRENAVMQRYWISVETGLLVAAETLLDDNSIYWMEASEPEEPAADAFTLPDGTVLLSAP